MRWEEWIIESGHSLFSKTMGHWNPPTFPIQFMREKGMAGSPNSPLFRVKKGLRETDIRARLQCPEPQGVGEKGIPARASKPSPLLSFSFSFLSFFFLFVLPLLFFFLSLYSWNCYGSFITRRLRGSRSEGPRFFSVLTIRISLLLLFSSVIFSLYYLSQRVDLKSFPNAPSFLYSPHIH